MVAIYSIFSYQNLDQLIAPKTPQSPNHAKSSRGISSLLFYCLVYCYWHCFYILAPQQASFSTLYTLKQLVSDTCCIWSAALQRRNLYVYNHWNVRSLCASHGLGSLDTVHATCCTPRILFRIVYCMRRSDAAETMWPSQYTFTACSQLLSSNTLLCCR